MSRFLGGKVFLTSLLITTLATTVSIGNPPTSYFVIKPGAFRSVQFVDESRGWIAGERGLFLTTDGGGHWQRQLITSLFPNTRRSITAVYRTGLIAWASQSEAMVNSEVGLVTASDSEAKWISRDIPKHLSDEFCEIRFANKREGWATGTLGRMYKTSDGGATWLRLKTPELHRNLYALFVVSPMEVWAAGALSVVLHTTNGGLTWERQILAGGFSNLYSIHFASAKQGWLCGQFGMMLHTSDGGKTWEQQATPLQESSQFLDVSFVNEVEGWAVGRQITRRPKSKSQSFLSSVILQTVNGGKSWDVSAKGIRDSLLDVEAVSQGKAWVVGEEGTVLRTTDNGKKWIPVKLEPMDRTLKN